MVLGCGSMLLNALHHGVHLFKVVGVKCEFRVEISAESHHTTIGTFCAEVKCGGSFVIYVLLSQDVDFVLLGLFCHVVFNYY